MPNGRRDGIPNVVVEAMAMGLPCVGTRAGGLEEAIVPGETGALAEPGNPASLAEAIESVLADPEALPRLGRAARLRVVERFDAARSFERTLALFEGREADSPSVAPGAGR
jgi:glycosyltransferase involved in cell wall biosynthesis